ncbi:GNAT family N-acetyltransferase [Ferrovibrio sp.]|uniref:GNAT family N-acetyltransferase n=1 Tax=Ferrovibrio sp. TaxID=1917215 RepID=UPI00311DE173
MSPPFAIAPASDADTDGIAALILPIQQAEFGIPITYEQQPDLRDIDGFYRQGCGGFWVAKTSAGAVVGSIALIDIGTGEAALRKMFVHRDWRGRDRGVAQALLDILLAHARGAGLDRILLGTTEKFLAAHRFYQKNGFARIDAAALPASFPRMAVDTVFFRLDL